MRTLTLMATCLLAACATPAQVTKANMKGTLDEFVGQPVEQAVARLGEPESSVPWGNYTLLGWSRGALEKRQVTIIAANFQTRTLPAATTRRFRVWQWCEVYLVASPEGKVTGWRYRGTPHGCGDYDKDLALAE